MWASVGMTQWWGHQWQKGWQSWEDEHVRGHLWLEMQAYLLYPQTGWSADPRSWKSSVIIDMGEKEENIGMLLNKWFTRGNLKCTVCIQLCRIVVGEWKYAQHTAHFSTFPALLAHFTRASRRTKSCLVRLANWTISIFLKKKLLYKP